MFASWNPDQPEITDLIVQHEPRTLQRLTIHKKDLLDTFKTFGNSTALAALQALPDKDGTLDEHDIDALLLTVHWEMQRLAEEFYHGHRVWELLRPLIAAIRKTGVNGTLRIVDVGCGIGYIPRWLSANISQSDYDVEFAGMDLNSVLIKEANRLAAEEHLPCKFRHGDVFTHEKGSHILLSTGVIHHFRGDALHSFLRKHEHKETQAFLHFDFQPWALAPWGSLFFHLLRMRTAIARHDGVLSASRAYNADTLLGTARSALPGFATGIFGARFWRTPLPCVFHALTGLRRNLVEPFRQHLGSRAYRLREIL